MAEKRMFSICVTGSDSFMNMSLEAQALYYALAIRADDDGFLNSSKMILRMTGAGDDSFRELLDGKFVIQFDSGVVAITHWNLHNTVRKDRYKPTIHQKEKSLVIDNGEGYELAEKIEEQLPSNQLGTGKEISGNQVGTGKEISGNQVTTMWGQEKKRAGAQYSIEESSIEESSIEESSIEEYNAREDGQAVSPSPSKKFKKPTIDEVRAYCLERNNKVDPEQFVDFYTSKGWKVGKEPMKDWKAAVRTWEKRDNKAEAPKTPPKTAKNVTQGDNRKYDFAALERQWARR